MTDLHANLPEVDALLAEREALHAWLTRLDAAPVSAPSAVRDRVRADYQQRLDGVIESLREHADTLAERLAADRGERADLAGQARAAQEALAEAELRHAVGEYDASRFESERLRYTSDLESFELSLMAVDERIEHLEAIAASLATTPGDGASQPRQQAETQDDDDGAEVQIEALAPEPEPEPEPGAASSTKAPEPEEPEPATAEDETLDSDALLAVFGIDGSPKPFVPEPPPSDAAPLSFTPSGTPPATPPLGMPMAEPPRFSPPSRPSSPPAKPVDAEVTPMFASGMVPQPEDDRDDLPEPEPAETVAKTVRCGECGAMNRPLEWYCEKCGAELTAM